MAIVKGGIGSMLSGKVEGLVYVQLNGQTISRKAPKHKKDSWTPGMLLNQQRFKEVNSFCAQFKYSVIPQIWNGAAQRMSGYAYFLKSNMAAFAPDGSLGDVQKLRFSTGKLPWPEGLEAQRSEGDANTIEVKWPKYLNVGGVQLRDELMVISAADGQYSKITGTGIERNALGGKFELPVLPVGATHIYLFFGSLDHRDYSESVCFEV
ncbi:MAG TPA: hypothetical protein VGK10_08890 [Prolixibacteraceae bacterium]|jgi:hypothetical protein